MEMAMKSSDKNNSASLFLASITGLLFLFTPVYAQHYDAYYLYLGNYPDNANPGFHEDVQGISHDDNNWFITQSDADDPNPAERSLWKIPVTQDLRSVSPNAPGVIRISLDDIPQLAGKGYDHFGDISYYKNENYDGKGYIVVPVTGGPAGILAVFRSSDLVYVGHAELSSGTNAGWCAIDPEGLVYTSGATINKCEIYQLRWDLVPNEIKMELIGYFSLFDESGNPLTLTHMQGGVISEDGMLLYVVSGFYDKHYPHDGINVFNIKNGRRVAHSTNGNGHFNYEFNAGTWPGESEEPEGITIWDLDDGRAPGITGQLHVLLLDNDASADEIYIKHYTNIIYVNGAYVGEDERGRPWDPFNTVTEAVNFAWDGAKIKIQNGSYAESITFIKKIQLLAKDGTVTVGNSGRLKFDTSAAINLTGGKCFFKLY
jgi:hypothetical protein